MEERQHEIKLMMEVRDGSVRAFEQLHIRYQSRLLNFFYGMTRDAEASSDLCQETFLRIWKIRKRYSATGSFTSYLFAVARMVLLEQRRETRRRDRLGIRITNRVGDDPSSDTVDLLESHDNPQLLAVRAETQDRIFAALDQLPEEQRIVFVLRNIRGLGLQDIAAALDCPINTVRSRKILAVKKLRHLLADMRAAVERRV